MLRRLSFRFDNMALALAVWLCVLPLIGLFVAPFFGLQVAAVTAAALLVAAIAICWGICSWKLFES